MSATLPETTDEWITLTGAKRLDRSGVLGAFARAHASAADLDTLLARSAHLEGLFAWDRSQPSGFRWTGTEADAIERDAVREALERLPESAWQ